MKYSLGGQTFRPMGLKVWRSCSTKKILKCLDVSDTRPLGPKQSTTLKRLPGHQCYAERVEGEPVFLQGTWFFPYALGTGDVIMWALLQLLQALHLALLSELLMWLLSHLFRPSELGLFELQVVFWPKQASERLREWFRYCAPLVCYHLWACLCLEKDRSACAIASSQLHRDLKGWIWTCLLQLGASLHGNTMRMMQMHLPALDFLKINRNVWVLLNTIWSFQFYSLVRKWNSELCTF